MHLLNYLFLLCICINVVKYKLRYMHSESRAVSNLRPVMWVCVGMFLGCCTIFFWFDCFLFVQRSRCFYSHLYDTPQILQHGWDTFIYKTEAGMQAVKHLVLKSSVRPASHACWVQSIRSKQIWQCACGLHTKKHPLSCIKYGHF